MSLKADELSSVWALCPADILLAVFKKLDIKSLLNCMNVNVYWRNLVDYYCEHVNLWQAMVQNTMDDEGIGLSEKSKLGWQEQFRTSQSWLNVKNVNVYLQHHYKFDNSVRNIYVNKDNLIVVTHIAVKYFNIGNFELIKEFELGKLCIEYEETPSMIVELSISLLSFTELTLTNKLYTSYDGSEKVTHYLGEMDIFKVHWNSFYVYTNKVLWVHTAKETGWEKTAMAKYHGTHKFSNIYIFKKNVYILLHSGSVLILDLECKLLRKVFNFKIPSCYRDSKPFMFHIHSLLFKAPMPDGQCVLCHERKHEYFVAAMARYGVTCLLEHGHTLILGFENGKIDIYLTRKLITAPSELPELRLNLENYLGKTDRSESSHITSLDIYEDVTGHHLFVSTMSNVYELLLQL